MKTKYKLNRRQAAWVAALRSGKYKQAKGYLRTSNGFCCLGVACDIASKHKWAKVEVEEGPKAIYYSGKDTLLPWSVQSALGFRENNAEIADGVRCKNHFSLVGANDSGASFKRIAAFVEKHPELVFTEESLIKIAPKKRAK